VTLIGRFVVRYAGGDASRLQLIITGAAAGLSTFMSNTGATAFFLPIVLSLSRHLRMSASKLLMPLAFASILASSVTLIGTSTNIVISGLMTAYGLPPLGMFELSVVGVPILLTGLLYLHTLGRRLIPDRSTEESILGEAGLQQYLFEVEVLSGSPLIGLSLQETKLGENLDLSVLRVVRDDEEVVMPSPDLILSEADLLLVEGDKEQILDHALLRGLEVKGRTALDYGALESEQVGVYEVLLLPGSPLLHRTIADLRLRERYGLQVLGMSHHGETRYGKLSQVPLEAGDQLLLQGQHQNIETLDTQAVIKVLRLIPWRRHDLKRSMLTVSIFLAALVAATLELLSLPIAIVSGVVLMFVSGCITPEEAYKQVKWSAVILIGSMLSLGLAMETTGTADFLADLIIEHTKGLSPVWLLGGFFALTMLLTQPMSNQAAAIVVVPVAMQTASQLGLNPRSFAVMIALGASCSFLTPLEPACLLVYGPGNYRFLDFFKAGLILTVAILLLSMVLVPLAWPL
jgi:di/tricarboxylate transporter